MTVLRLSLERELDWAVFEPNGDGAVGQVRRLVAAYLTQLYHAGAFTGDTAKEGFFVRVRPDHHDVARSRQLAASSA